MLCVLLTSCTGSDQNSVQDSEFANTDESTSVQTSLFESDFTVDDDFSYLDVTDDAEGWESTVKYSNASKNAIDLKYTDPARSSIAFSNNTFSASFGLNNENEQLIKSFSNKNGIEYFSNSADAYMADKSGMRFASLSGKQPYMNTFRMGYYYYDIHVMDLAINDHVQGENTTPAYDLIGKQSVWSSNDIYDIKSSDGKLTYKVKNNIDPYCYRTGFSISTQKYNAIKITLTSEASAACQLFIYTSQYNGFNAQQMVSFPITPGVEKTYTVSISGLPGYTGDIRGVRIDCGSVNDETITVSSMQAVYDLSMSPSVRLERIFHTYSDKLHEEIRFLAVKNIDDMEYFGVQTKIPADQVRKFVLGNDSSVFTKLDSDIISDITYVGFDIADAGVLGYIVPKGENMGNISVELKDGYYIINRYIPVQSLKKGQEIRLGHRIYNDSTHSFDSFLRQTYVERNPLKTVSVTVNIDGSKYIGYDGFIGAYVFSVNGTDFSTAYYDRPDKYFKVPISVNGDDSDRRIYIKTTTSSGCLEAGAVIGDGNRLLPLPVQVCKNFKGEYEEPVFYPDDTAYGEVYFPITVKAKETKELTVLNIYQNWGHYPIKQLSSIQFIAPYYHLSLGTTETNCIAPYFVNGKDAWTLPDFRALSSPLWTTQPQHYSAGQIFFLKYTDKNGKSYNSESQNAIINSAGPVYADIDMEYLSDDGRIKVEYKHAELPQTDETRTYYQIKMTVLQDVSFNDFKKDFSFVSMNGRHVFYTKLSYLDENGQIITKDLSKSKTDDEYITLSKNAPFFCYYLRDGNSTEVVNMALIVKNSSITVNGEEYTGNFVLKNSFTGGLNLGALTLDLGETTLKKGDILTLNLVLLPWGSYNEEKIDSVLNVRQDSCISPYTLDVKIGKDISQEFLPSVMADGGSAEFTISGGDNNAVVRVYGFSSYKKPDIYELSGEEYTKYNVSKKEDFEGYQVYLDEDGTYSFAFVIDMSLSNSRTFRITQ